MPVWHEQTKQLVASGKLVVIGIAQEQHADRCRLFAQWKGIDWPILHDPLNLVGLGGVPMLVAIDEHGIVRSTTPNPATFAKDFALRQFPAPKAPAKKRPETLPDPRWTRRHAGEARNSAGWLAHGDALMLAGLPPQIDEAIQAYGRACDANPRDGVAFFRLGVTHRIRFDRPQRQPDDFQAAVDAWRKALDCDPNDYIIRRRIQQYGPRLDRPYSFYDWVKTAKREITQRGDTPVELTCTPVGAELAQPADKFKYRKKEGPKGDDSDRIDRDRKKLVEITQAIVRGTDKKNRNIVQVHLTLRPNPHLGVQWSNEAEPLRLWLKKPKTGRLSNRFVEFAHPPAPTTSEERTLCFEVRLPSRQMGSLTVKGYVLYNVCEGKDGKCRMLRQDVKMKIKL